MGHIKGKRDQHLHYGDGSHRGSAVTANGRDVDRYHNDIQPHLAAHKREVFAAYVTRDGRQVSPMLDGENAAWTWILKHQGQSVDWAMKYEGYAIVPVTFEHRVRTPGGVGWVSGVQDGQLLVTLDTGRKAGTAVSYPLAQVRAYVARVLNRDATPGYRKLMGEVRLWAFDDPWSTALAWTAAIAEVLFVKFEEVVDGFDPGPSPPTLADIEDNYPASMLLDMLYAGDYTVADMRAVNAAMSRYAGWARRAARAAEG